MFKSFLYLSQVNKCQIEIVRIKHASIQKIFPGRWGGVLISDKFLSLLGGGGGGIFEIILL